MCWKHDGTDTQFCSLSLVPLLVGEIVVQSHTVTLHSQHGDYKRSFAVYMATLLFVNKNESWIFNLGYEKDVIKTLMAIQT